jgi:hypothetical protein
VLFAVEKEVLPLKTEMTVTAGQSQEQDRVRTLRRRDALRREIVLALVVKIAVIYALWYAFFSEPVDDSLTGAQVGHAVFGAAPTEQVPAQQQTLTLTKPSSEEN